MIDAGPLPPGFLIGGAVRGLFKSPAAPSLPANLWARSVRLKPADYEAYAHLCGFGSGAGVPLTWPYILSFPLQMRLMMARDFPFPAMGLVHMSNTIRQEGRLSPGDDLRLTCRADRLYAHAKGQAFSLKTQARRDGAVIWSCTSLYLRRGPAGMGERMPGLPVGQVPLGQPDQKIETIKADVETARAYARLSGDANPIHTSALMARILGFSRPLAHGMWTKARALSALTEGRVVDAAEAEVSFQNPLLMPAEAELYAASSGTGCDFDCRSTDGARTFLLGRLSLL